MKFFCSLIISCLISSGLFAQRISDSLGFDNMSRFYEGNKGAVSYFRAEDSTYVICEIAGSSEKEGNPASFKSVRKEGNYFEYDNLRRIRLYGSYAKNKEEALFIYFDSEGRLKRTTHYHKGKLNGQSKNYYSNGTMRLSQDYKNGKKDGEILGFYIDGTRLFTGKYKKDKMIGQRMYYDVKGNPANGEMTWRHESGVVKLTGKCINGLPEGRFSHYDENGELELQVDYLRGLPHGAYIKYNKGLVEFKECYELGHFTMNNCR